MTVAEFTEKVRNTCTRYCMGDGGVAILGLSGGGDSVALLYAMKEIYEGELVAVHVNHGIRKETADTDEAFSRALCERLGVRFELYREDVPSIARERGVGYEEAGRDVRRRAFVDAAEKYGAKTLMLAHNADDAAETVIFNLIRGTGLRGMRGILPVSELEGLRIVRPLIDLSKEEILGFLDSNGLEYRTDETNLSVEYSRNRIRLNVLPELTLINPSCRENVNSFARRASEAYSLISELSQNYTEKHPRIERASFLSLHPAVMSDVLAVQYSVFGKELEARHLSLCSAFIKSAKTADRLNMPCGVDLICDGDEFYFARQEAPSEYRIPLSLGYTELPHGKAILLGTYNTQPDINIYNLVKRIIISSVIFEKGVFVRNRNSKDEITYSGMTHSCNKLLSGGRIPVSERKDYPVVCSDEEIIWIPPFTPRDGIRGDGAYSLTFLSKKTKG